MANPVWNITSPVWHLTRMPGVALCGSSHPDALTDVLANVTCPACKSRASAWLQKLDADDTLENAYRTARTEALAEGRNLDAADGETAYKLGWIDGHNAALRKARGLLAPAVADFQKLLEG